MCINIWNVLDVFNMHLGCVGCVFYVHLLCLYAGKSGFSAVTDIPVFKGRKSVYQSSYRYHIGSRYEV